MNERDELALELFIADNYNQSREQSVVDWEWFNATDKFRGRIEHYKTMALGAIEAGYVKPRTITTVEELDDLGRNAAVLAANGAVLVNDGESDIQWASFAEDAFGGPVWIDPVDVKLPATVLFEPEGS